MSSFRKTTAFDAGRRANNQGSTLLRVLIPTGPGVNGGHLEQLSAERLRPMFGCSGGSLRLALGGLSLDVAASTHAVKRGDILKTVRPGRPTHQQEIQEDAVALEIDVPANGGLARAAQALADRGQIGCRLNFTGQGAAWKTCTASGQHFGRELLSTTFSGIESIELGTPNGEECHLTIV